MSCTCVSGDEGDDSELLPFVTGASSEKGSLSLKEEKMEKMDGDSTKSESSGEGSKSSVTSPGGGGNGPPSKRSRYGGGANSPGYLDSGESFPNYMWGCLTFSSALFFMFCHTPK